MISCRFSHCIISMKSSKRIKHYHKYRKHRYISKSHILPTKLEYINCTLGSTELRYEYLTHDEPVITEFMTYNQFLNVTQRRFDVICYSQITDKLLIPRYIEIQDWSRFTNQDRFYFPIYIQITKSNYHAAVLLWDIKQNKLFYFDSWGEPNNTVLITLKKFFPHIKKIECNVITHQKYDYLCTSYAFNTADRFMSGESFYNICHNETSVDDLLKYRDVVKNQLHHNNPHEIIEYYLRSNDKEDTITTKEFSNEFLLHNARC
jgi:hypothetical protein